MSTNYYLRNPDGATLHVGLSAGGLFHWAAHPDAGITSTKHWRERMSEPGSVLMDEYDNEASPDELFAHADSLRDEIRANRNNVFYNNTRQPESGRSFTPGERYLDEDCHLMCAYEFS